MSLLLQLQQVGVVAAGVLGLLSNPKATRDALESTTQLIQIKKQPRPTFEVISTLKPPEVHDVKTTQGAANIPRDKDSRAAPSAATGGAVGAAGTAAGVMASIKRGTVRAAKSAVDSGKKNPLVAGALGVVAVGAAVYYMSRKPSGASQPSSQGSATPSSSQPKSQAREPGGPDGPDEPPSDDEDTADESPPQINKDIHISKRLMREILDKNGKAIWQKFQQGLTADRIGTIWRDPQGNFRIDAGSTLNKHANIKTWNLQVNRNPNSPAAKNLLKKLGRGTDERLFWGQWDMANPPEYASWVQEILHAFV